MKLFFQIDCLIMLVFISEHLSSLLQSYVFFGEIGDVNCRFCLNFINCYKSGFGKWMQLNLQSFRTHLVVEYRSAYGHNKP